MKSFRDRLVAMGSVVLLAGSLVILQSSLNSFAQNSASPGATKMIKPIVYPSARKSDQVDDYHGVKVKDTYRWLEDLDSEETRAWVAAENKLTFGYLDEIPARPGIKERLTKLWNYEKYGVPFKESGRYFYFRNTGLQNQYVLYTVRSLDAEPQM